MPGFDPFKLFYSVVGALQDFLRNNFVSKWLRKSSRSRRSRSSSSSIRGGLFSNLVKGFKKFFLIRWIVSLFLAFSVIPQYLDSKIGSASKKSDTIKSFSSRLQLVYQAVFVEPFRWIVGMLGMSFEWVRTRNWLRLSLASIPAVALSSLIFIVWFAGRLNEDGALADWYRELGDKEIESWEANLGRSTGLEAAMQSEGSVNSVAASGGGEASKISSYAELLFKRIQLLAPNHDSQIVIAATMMQRGAISSGQDRLKRLAPEDRPNNPKAHAMMAMSYLIQFMKSRDSNLLPAFEHHAESALRWRGTPKEVLTMAGDLHWQRGNQQKAFEMYQRAAAIAPEMNVALFQRALAAGQPRLAELARERGIEHLQLVLRREPGRVDAISQLAMLVSTSEEGALQAEELITKAQALRPSPGLTRALSEVYRMRFINAARTNPNAIAGFVFLDKAMVVDPSNPLVAEFIELMVKQASKNSDELGTALSDMLVSGRATTGTHAMLAEYHMLKNNDAQALVHLEQVFQVAPSAVKYANHLSTIYAEQRNSDQALAVALQSRDVLDKSERLSEKYVDDLLETIGKIYHQKKQYSEATEAYLKCLSIAPNRAGTRRLLAKLYRQTGDDASADNQEQLAKQIDQKVAEYTAFEQQSAKSAESEQTSASSDGTSPDSQGASPVSEGAADDLERVDSTVPVTENADDSSLEISTPSS